MNEVTDRKAKQQELEEALEAEVQTTLLKTSISPETLPEAPKTEPKSFKTTIETDFFTLEAPKELKMRQNVLALEPQEINPNSSCTSQELILGSRDEGSLSSPKYEGNRELQSNSPLELSAIPGIPQFVDVTDFPLTFRNQGGAILRENPSFSVVNGSKTDNQKGENPLFRPVITIPRPEFNFSQSIELSPEQDLLKSPFFNRKRLQLKRISDQEIAYQVSEEWVLEHTNATDVIGAVKHYSTTVKTTKGYSFVYIDSKEREPLEKIGEVEEEKGEGKTGKIGEEVVENLFKKFLVQSVRFTAKEAYKHLLPLSRTLVHDQLFLDSFSPSPKEGFWSGSDVSPDFDTTDHLFSLNKTTIFLWKRGCRGSFQRFFHPFSLISSDKRYFENFMTICVVLNTVVLAINHYQIDQESLNMLDNCNLAFTVVFAIEMCVKILGMGVIGYFRVKMNVFDCIIVVLSILELTLLADSGFNGLNAIRIFRAFRVLRVARLLRWMPYMQKIMLKIAESASKFMYLGMLLLLFLIIYALFGMQLFGGKFATMANADRANYDNFNFAFLATFQILTTENWHNVLHNGMRAVGAQAAIYFVSCIFLGNFVMLNLFLAILLDAFEEESEDAVQSITTTLSTQTDSTLTKSTRVRKKIESIRKKIEEIEQESIESASGSIASVFDAPKAKEMYEGNKCEKSYFLFSRTNKVRIFLNRVTTSGRFERFIMLLIALSSLKLIWETYLLKEPPGSVKLDISDWMDTGFTVLFTVEMLMKSVSMGVVLDKGTYLREGWNVVDCFIVTFSLIDLSVSSINIPIIKVFRLLRVLRPLRFISHNVSMRIIVSALLESMSVLAHVTVVMLIVWLIFAILGVSLFAGKMYTCSIPTITTRAECEYYAGTWVNAPYHFDDVIHALVTLFDLTSPENWNDTMYRAIDTVNKEVAMSANSSPVSGYFFVVFIIVSNFFFLNLFLGVMFDKFEKAKRENTSISEMLLLPDQYRWVEMMKLVIKTKQKVDTVVVDVGQFRTAVCTLVGHWAFNAFIMACIICNMVVMGMAYDEAAQEYSTTLEDLNYSFTAVFAVEATLKITGLGLSYFKDRWNQFDFFVVTMSLLDITLSNTLFSAGTNKMMTVGPQLARTLRVLRVSRMLRLIKSLQIMDDLIGMLALSLPAMVNVLTLLALVFVMYGVLGVFLFHSVDSGIIVDEYNNFSNFGMSILILIRSSTGEDWNYTLVDCASVSNPWIAHTFFFSFVVITTFIMYNMFVMVMLQEYENYQNNPNSSFKLYKLDLSEFNKAWNSAADAKNPAKLDSERLFLFAYQMPEICIQRDERGNVKKSGEKETKYGIRKRLGAMGIIPDESDCVYYHDVLFKYIRMRYGIHSKLRTRYSKKIVEKEELFYTKRLRKIVKMSKMSSASGLLVKGKTDMKFFDILFLKTVFRSWKGWTKQRMARKSVSVTPPMSLNYPGANSDRADEDEGRDELGEEPVFLREATLSREVRTSRMSTNFSKNRTDTQE